MKTSSFRSWLDAVGAGLLLVASNLVVAAPQEALPFKRYVEPEFPRELSLSSSLTQGEATIAYTIDSEGRVEDALVLSASHPAFGQSVLDAMRSWQADPDQIASLPGKSKRELIRYLFAGTGAIVSMTQIDATMAALRPVREVSPRFLSWNALDSPPARTVFVSPVYPKTLAPPKKTGRATISFVIDSSGAVRVPAVTHADDGEFGAAALSAVKQWRFAAPEHKGRPINVMVERTFTFGPRPSA